MSILKTTNSTTTTAITIKTTSTASTSETWTITISTIYWLTGATLNIYETT